MAIQVLSGASNTIWTIDSTSNAGHVTLYDQYGNAMSDVNSLANILNALNSAVTIILGGQSTIGINVGGTTGTLTLSFEATIDNSTWFPVTMTPATGGATVTTTSANGQWVGSVSGYYAVRARISAFTSGSMTVSVVVTPGQSKTGAQTITTASALSVEITDGSADGPAAVKPASTAAVVGDPALVVAVSPNNSVAITAASLPLPTGAATASNQTNGNQETQIVQGGNTAAVTVGNALKVDGSAVTQPVSGTGSFTVAQATAANLNATVTGTLTVNQGTDTVIGNAWPIEITDSINGPAAIKASSTPASATDLALVVAVSPNNSVAITAATLPLPTGAATSANLTTIGTQTTEINDGTHTATIKAASTAAIATDTALVVAISPNNVVQVAAFDANPATQNITAQDVGSTSTTVANGQVLVTGTPTAISAASFTYSSYETIKIQVTGTWTGSITSEISLDGGTTWVATDLHQTGTAYTMNTFTSNFIGGINVSGTTNFRMRATAAWTGTATVKLVESGQTNTVYVTNAQSVRDGTVQSTLSTIKPASTAAVATDTSFVTALSPNSPLPNTGSADANNSSTATLGGAGVFTGTATSSFGYSSIGVTVMPIGSSAPPGTLSIQQSTDGTNWDIQDNYSVTGGTASPTGEFDVGLNLRASFYRIVYTNGATAQTAFRLQTVKIPIQAPHADAPTQKGIQAATFLPVQQPHESGRVVRVFAAAAAAPAVSETMVTLTPYTNFTAGATGTSFQPTAGKIFRIQSLTVSNKTSSGTSTAIIQIHFRISNTGAVTTATPVMQTVNFPPTAAVTGTGSTIFVSFPDGLELSGTQQFGISAIATATTNALDIQLLGFEY